MNILAARTTELSGSLAEACTMQDLTPLHAQDLTPLQLERAFQYLLLMFTIVEK